MSASEYEIAFDISDVDSEVQRIGRLLDIKTQEFGRLAREQAILKVAYKLAYARAMKQASGTNREMREAEADLATQGELENMEEAMADFKDIANQLESLRSQLVAVLSIGKNIRSGT